MDDANTRFVVLVDGEVEAEELTYDEATRFVNSVCDAWESMGFDVDRSWASSGNFYAARAVEPNEKDHLIAVEYDRD